MKGVQCYELLVGIALKIHIFSFSFFHYHTLHLVAEIYIFLLVTRLSYMASRHRNIDILLSN